MQSFLFFLVPGRNQISETKDDTSATALHPSTTPASRQIAQSPRTHTWSTSVRTGSSPQTKPTSTPYKYAAPPAPLSPARTDSLLSQVGQTSVCPLLSRSFRHSCSSVYSRALHQPHQICRQPRKLRPPHATLRMNHDVPTHRYLQTMATHDFSNSPPDAIAHHRPAQRLFNAETEAAHRRLVGAGKYCEVGTGAALPGAVHGIEIAAPHQPCLARKVHPPGTTRA
jgi:hypothetical protein